MMADQNIIYRFHATRRMFERKISEAEILDAISTGRVIEDYPNDTPYPSCLKLKFVNSRPIHVVVAQAIEEKSIIVITVYEPSLEIWEQDFEKRKKK